MHKTMATLHAPDQASVWDQALDWLLLSQAKPQDKTIADQLAAWLAEDPRHQQAYSKAAKVWQLTGDAPAATLGTADIPLAPAAATPHRLPRRLPPRRWRWAPAAMAMGLCLAFLLSPQGERLVWSDYHTGTNQQKSVTLPDGSRVILDAESAISVDQTGQQRRVTLLQGRAFFEVSHDQTRPFLVTAGNAVVRVTGTAFGVDRAKDEVRVEVERGSVAVATHEQDQTQDQDQAHDSRTVALTPGQRAEVSATSGAISVGPVAPSHLATWRSGHLVVEGARLAEIVTALRPHYQGLILLQAPKLAERKITGVFDLSHPQDALQTIVALQGGEISQISPYVIRITD
jgi:transmembrane sensor